MFLLGLAIGATSGLVVSFAIEWWGRLRARRTRLNLDSVNRNFRR